MTESTATASSKAQSADTRPAGESLTVRDNRTGQEYDVPITDGARSQMYGRLMGAATISRHGPASGPSLTGGG